jgi:hypothetical protein
VLPRGFVALFGTLIFSVAFALVIDHPERAIPYWILSFAFAWSAWVWLPERKVSRTRWWLTKTAQFAAFLLAFFLLALLVQLAVSPG